MVRRSWPPCSPRPRSWAPAAALLGACGGASPDAADPTTDATDGPTANRPTAGEEEHPCAWPTRADETVNNIAYPDTAATYWGQSFSLAEGERLELAGSFPDARYASFITYRPTGGAVDVLTDRDIEPDDGSTNPFAGEGRDDGPHAYTVTVRPDRTDDASGNDLGADTTGIDPTGGDDVDGELVIDDDVAARVARDRIGSAGEDGVRGTILYRVYTPTDPDDRTGGAGLPAVTLVAADGTRTSVPGCPEPGENPAARALVEHYGPATDRAAPPAPIFVRPQGDSARLFPNPDNVYVATILEHEPGRIAVVRGRAPRFPDTAAGDEVGGDEQVRYWSMCTNEYRKPYPVTECAADDATALDADGWFTYVISTPEDRPGSATTENGVTWLDLGSTEVDVVLLLRHMLPDDDFPNSALELDPGQLATQVMGQYAPVGAYCTTAQFDAGDAACRPA